MVVTVGCGAAGVAVGGIAPLPGGILGLRPAAVARPAVAGVKAHGVTRQPAIPAFSLAGFDGAPSPDLGLHAKSAILVDLDRGKVLWAEDPHARRPPASLTKLMTAVVATDLVGPDAQVTVTGEAAAAEPSRMGLVAGETLTVRDLLYGALLNSGNDAALALGDGIVPPDRFLALMNAKAAYLHLADTHFSTPNGLTDPNNYTSSYDLAVLSAYVVRNYPALAEIAGTRDWTIPAAGNHPAFYPHNVNHFLDVYPGATGLKTGFTDDAKGCLVGTATRNGRHLLLVLMGSDVTYIDGVKLMDHGFATPAS
jgi:serine-type D-Ala-D-Ala carboxypeptidase (penicillin-binding protein 5/6)